MKNKKWLLFIFCLCSIFMFGCSSNDGIVRIHIRANSNAEIDQNVKLLVRDEVIGYITPLLASCSNSNDVKNILEENLESIEKLADNVLLNNDFTYSSKARISNEYFPTRSYDGEVYPADYYDALILELGTGEGDNWWCVAYPPLCFVGDGVGDVKYRSKLLELINNFFGV